MTPECKAELRKKYDLNNAYEWGHRTKVLLNAIPELLDELDKKDKEIERLQSIETAAYNLIYYSDADHDCPGWDKYFDNLLAVLYADPVADEKNYCRAHYIPREIKNDQKTM